MNDRSQPQRRLGMVPGLRCTDSGGRVLLDRAWDAAADRPEVPGVPCGRGAAGDAGATGVVGVRGENCGGREMMRYPSAQFMEVLA